MGSHSSELPPTSMSLRWLRAEIDRLRTDIDKCPRKDWIEAKLETFLSRGDETKNIAISAKEKADARHICFNDNRLSDIEDRLKRWDSWWRGVMITVISAVVVGGSAVGAAWYRTENLQGNISQVREDVEALRGDIEKVDESQREISQFLKDWEKDLKDKEEKRELELRAILKEAIRGNRTEGLLK